MTISAVVSHCVYANTSDVRTKFSGGSTTVHPYDNTEYEPIELGASIFVKANKNLLRATREFNLSVYGFEDEVGALGIWDGKQFLHTVRDLHAKSTLPF